MSNNAASCILDRSNPSTYSSEYASGFELPVALLDDLVGHLVECDIRT